MRHDRLGLRLLAASFLMVLATGVLAKDAGHSAPSRQESFFTKMSDDLVVFTHGALLDPSGIIPKDVAKFDEAKIRGGGALLHKLRDKDGNVIGFGSQLEVMVPGKDTKYLLDWPTAWTIVIPGRGTLFLYEIEKPVKLFAKMAQAQKDPATLREPIAEQTTAGPLPSGEGVIIGGTGEFDGKKGSFIEINRFVEPAPPGSAVGLKGDIEVRVTFTN
jgi:hypothetical protein